MAGVRFLRNDAGHRIAYTDEGTGPALVVPPWWVSHLERDAQHPGYARFFERLARHFRVVRFDRIDVGLSDRVGRAHSLDTEVADLDAMVRHLGVEHINLLACSCAGPVALAWAASHQDRVDKLVLYATYLNGADLSLPDLRTSLVGLVRAHWGLGSSTLADLFFPNDPQGQQGFKALQKVGADNETAARLLELTFAHDARAVVDRVRAPALVVHRRHDRVIAYTHGRALAAALPNATLVTLEGSAHMAWAGDGDAVADAIETFLGAARKPSPPADVAELRRRGDVWSVRFGAREALVAHAKGIVDLATLLARPGQDVHVLDLVGAGDERRDKNRGDPMLDREAMASLRRRLAEIDDGIRDAEAANDDARYRKLEQEREAVRAHLAAATGLRGRARAMNDPVERARKAVAARIRDAIKHIGAVHPPLGAHLALAVETGVCCAYRGDIRWNVALDAI